jgi:hypothetical protein
MFMDVSRSQAAHLCLTFPLPVYPTLLKPEAEISPLPSFIPQSWHLSIQSHNLVLQPQELLRSGRNIGSSLSPFFVVRGHCHDLQSSFHILL